MKEPKKIILSYREMKSLFQDRNTEDRKSGKDRKALKGYIVFTKDSFLKEYSEKERTYAVGSKEKAFCSWMGGYSLYGMSLEGEDFCRLESYMEDEGNKDGWKIDHCYMLEEEEEC